VFPQKEKLKTKKESGFEIMKNTSENQKCKSGFSA